MTLQDLPEVTTTVPSSKEDEEILDLPEVPSKPPVPQKDVADKEKGLSLPRSPSPSVTESYHFFSFLTKLFYIFPQFWRNLHLLEEKYNLAGCLYAHFNIVCRDDTLKEKLNLFLFALLASLQIQLL